MLRVFGDRRTLAVLLAIVAVGAGLRLYTYRGLWGTDDAEYARLANAMATGRYGEFVQENYVDAFNAPAQLPGRVGMVVPLAALFRVGGVSETTLVLYPFLASVAGIIVAYLTGHLLFGASAGLVAAALWALVPEDIEAATYYLPDGIASMYGSLGVLVLLFVLVTRIERQGPRLLWGLLAGVFFGASWLTKESIVYLVPFTGVLLVADARRDLRSAISLWSGVALASGGILLAEMATYQVMKGDFLLRMHETERSHVQAQSYLFYEGSRFGWPEGGSYLKAVIKRLVIEGPSVIALNTRYLFLPFFGLLATAHAIYGRDRSFWLPAVWLGSLAFMYNFASASFASYTPLVLYSRYLHPLLLPAAVLTAGLIVKLSRPGPASAGPRSEARFWGGAVAVAVLFVGLYASFREVRDIASIKRIFEVREVATLVSPTDRIYTDPLSVKSLEFHWKYPDSHAVADFEGMSPEAVVPGSFVLMDEVRLDWLQVNVSMWLTEDYGYHRPDFDQPPPTWDPVWRNANAVLYRVTGG